MPMLASPATASPEMAATASGRNSPSSMASAVERHEQAVLGDRAEERRARRLPARRGDLDRDRDAAPAPRPARSSPAWLRRRPKTSLSSERRNRVETRRVVRPGRATRAQPLTSKPSPVSATNTSSSEGPPTRKPSTGTPWWTQRRDDLLRRPPRRGGPVADVGRACTSVSPSSAHDPRRRPRLVGLDHRRGLGPGAHLGAGALGDAAGRRASRRGGCTSARPRRAGGCETSTVVPSSASDRDQGPDLAGALRVEAVGGLVEHQQVARTQQRGGDGQPLAHAEGVGAVALAGRGQQARPGRGRRRSGPAPSAASVVRSAASSRARLSRPER